MSKLKWFNLALRGLMEIGVIFALAYWGYQLGNNTGMRILFGILAPLVGFGIWGSIDFHQAGKLAEPLRLLEELIISGLAAIALVISGQQLLGWSLALISIFYHILVYLAGDKLLKQA